MLHTLSGAASIALTHLVVYTPTDLSHGRMKMTELVAYDVAGAQRALGNVGRSTVYRLLADGKLEARKIGTRVVITAESVRQYIASAPKPRMKRI